MTIVGFWRREPQLTAWAKVVPAAVALVLLSGCVVVPAYGPGGYYRQPGYYAPGYYYPYYRDRNDYYRGY